MKAVTWQHHEVRAWADAHHVELDPHPTRAEALAAVGGADLVVCATGDDLDPDPLRRAAWVAVLGTAGAGVVTVDGTEPAPDDLVELARACADVIEDLRRHTGRRAAAIARRREGIAGHGGLGVGEYLDPDGRIRFDPEHPVAGEILRRRLEGWSWARIARHLDERGDQPPRGTRWSDRTCQRVWERAREHGAIQ